MKISKCCGAKVKRDPDLFELTYFCTLCGEGCEIEETEPEQDEDVGDRERER